MITVRQLEDDEQFVVKAFSDQPILYTGDNMDDAIVVAYLAAQKQCFTQFGVFIDGVFEESFEDLDCNVTLDEADIRALLAETGHFSKGEVSDLEEDDGEEEEECLD